MYDTIMGLPLFAGASHEKISEVIGRYKFHFLKYTEGQTIVTAGETCTHLKCIISGSVGLTVTNETRRFCVRQTLNAPEKSFWDIF